jgi:hypothetical protein
LRIVVKDCHPDSRPGPVFPLVTSSYMPVTVLGGCQEVQQGIFLSIPFPARALPLGFSRLKDADMANDAGIRAY